MRSKERFRAITNFQPTDRPWRFETLGFWTETLTAWRSQGLPFWVRSDPAAFVYFGYDRWIPLVVGDHLQPGFFPAFKRIKISDHGDYAIWQNLAGGCEKVFANAASALPATVKAPVESMDDLRRLLPRLDPDAPGRLGTLIDRASIRYTRRFGHPLGILYCGLFGALRHLLGLERFMMGTRDDPELLHAIGTAWERLVVGVARRMARHRPIWAGFWEDMCYKNGMFISPAMYREFITPYFSGAVAALYDQGIEFTWVDSDGDVTGLIPLIEKVGIKGMMPFEVQAGMDVNEVRKNHPDLVIIGGLDKRRLAEGRQAMELELQEKVVPLLRQGGYIPGLDHAVPPDVSLADFRWLVRRLRGAEMAACCSGRR